eukprot:scaffold15771_cov27-Tisochrysis_lutea.AAC.1
MERVGQPIEVGPHARTTARRHRGSIGRQGGGGWCTVTFPSRRSCHSHPSSCAPSRRPEAVLPTSRPWLAPPAPDPPASASPHRRAQPRDAGRRTERSPKTPTLPPHPPRRIPPPRRCSRLLFRPYCPPHPCLRYLVPQSACRCGAVPPCRRTRAHLPWRRPQRARCFVPSQPPCGHNRHHPLCRWQQARTPPPRESPPSQLVNWSSPSSQGSRRSEGPLPQSRRPTGPAESQVWVRCDVLCRRPEGQQTS